MGAKARGFLLFSFAFSSVLSSPEIAEIAIPTHETLAHTRNSSACAFDNTSRNAEINCEGGKKCASNESNVEKREVIYGLSREPEWKYDEREKRARVGFTGMRGKKEEYGMENYVEKRSPIETDLGGFEEVLQKRSQLDFDGMRGKNVEEKRVKMAFHGMRGKKNEDYDVYEEEPFRYELPSGEENNEDLSEGWDKRSMGFHGMRGRRRNQDLVMQAKRRPFPFEVGQSGYDLKRAMGFLGMRGKKVPEIWDWADTVKRGLQSGFYGMKGKKAQSGFFGMRGKKNSLGNLSISGEGPKRNKLVEEFEKGQRSLFRGQRKKICVSD